MVAVDDMWYLIPGKHIQEIARPILESRLEELSVWMDEYGSVDVDTLAVVLTNFTRRNRGFI